MAYVTDITTSLSSSILSAAHTAGSVIATFFKDVLLAGDRADMIAELQSLDDAALRTKHGISRGQIVSYVFRDKIYP